MKSSRKLLWVWGLITALSLTTAFPALARGEGAGPRGGYGGGPAVTNPAVGPGPNQAWSQNRTRNGQTVQQRDQQRQRLRDGSCLTPSGSGQTRGNLR